MREGGRVGRTGHARVDFADFLDLIAILVDDPSWRSIGDQVSGVCAEVEILRNLLLERRREAQVIHVDVGEGVLEMGKGGRVREGLGGRREEGRLTVVATSKMSPWMKFTPVTSLTSLSSESAWTERWASSAISSVRYFKFCMPSCHLISSSSMPIEMRQQGSCAA